MNELCQLSKRHPVFDKAASQAFGYLLTFPVPLWQQRQQLTLPDDDAQADMYLYTVAALEAIESAYYSGDFDAAALAANTRARKSDNKI